jgi:ribonuclease E
MAQRNSDDNRQSNNRRNRNSNERSDQTERNVRNEPQNREQPAGRNGNERTDRNERNERNGNREQNRPPRNERQRDEQPKLPATNYQEEQTPLEVNLTPPDEQTSNTGGDGERQTRSRRDRSRRDRRNNDRRSRQEGMAASAVNGEMAIDVSESPVPTVQADTTSIADTQTQPMFFEAETDTSPETVAEEGQQRPPREYRERRGRTSRRPRGGHDRQRPPRTAMTENAESDAESLEPFLLDLTPDKPAKTAHTEKAGTSVTEQPGVEVKPVAIMPEPLASPAEVEATEPVIAAVIATPEPVTTTPLPVPTATQEEPEPVMADDTVAESAAPAPAEEPAPAPAKKRPSWMHVEPD